jgi:MbtH protein
MVTWADDEIFHKQTRDLQRRETMEEREDNTIYKVVVNHEEQYSIWPVEKENALGWKDAGKSGTKAARLAYIKDVWTDMRPLSLRRTMVAAAKS